MGIPAGNSRIVLVGHLSGGEIFETGFWIGTAASSESEANSTAGDINGSFETHALSFLKALIPSDSGYDQVRMYSYPTGGPTATFIGSADVTGGTGIGTGLNPLQTAWVVTLLTGLSGRQNRGRMYLPATGEALTSGHQFNPTDTAALATTIGNWFKDLATAHQPVVLSQTASATHPVTTVRVDSKPDIQRRRADQLAATTTSSASATP